MPQVRTSPRKRPRQDRAKATVEAILDATAHVLVKQGYERTTTNRIAERAGVSVGSLYQYFPNKQALVAALIDRHCEEIMVIVQAKLVEVADAPLRKATRAVVDAMLEAHQVEPELHKVLTEQVPAVGRMKRLREVSRQVEALVRAFFERRRDLVKPKDLDLAAFILVRSVDAVTHAAVIERPEALGDDLAEELTDLIAGYAFEE
jgi:AcrR family transcriptional regulator